MQLHTNEEHPDVPLLEHVRELIAKLDALGIVPSPTEEGDDGAGDWEGINDSEGEGDDGDVDMI